MPCVEYHDLPLFEAGIIRPGQKEVWFKNVVHDVCACTWEYSYVDSFESSRTRNFLMGFKAA